MKNFKIIFLIWNFIFFQPLKDHNYFFGQKTLKTTISIAKWNFNFNFFAYLIVGSCIKLNLKLCKRIFKNFDHVNCKIFASKVKKTSFSLELVWQIIRLWIFLTPNFYNIDLEWNFFYFEWLRWGLKNKVKKYTWFSFLIKNLATFKVFWIPIL